MGIQVRLVSDVGKAVLRDVVIDSGAGRIQQGADDAVTDGGNAGKALGAGAAKQLQQDRFGLVVAVVGGGDKIRGKGIRRAAEEVVAGAAARLLHRQAPDGAQGVDVHRFGVEGNVPFGAEGADQVLVTLGRGTHTVVQVGGSHAEIAGPAQLPQAVQQADGVAAAGHGAEDQPAGGREHPPARHPRGQVQGLTHPRHSGSPACRRQCTRASSGAQLFRSRRGGSWLRCTRPRCASRHRCYSSRPGRGT